MPDEPEIPNEPEIPKNVRQVKPEQMLEIMQNKLTIVEGNSEKERQRIIDQIFTVVMKYAELDASLAKEITLLKDEVTRLQKLCKDNKIDPSPPKPKKQNRSQRRKAARVAKKAQKATLGGSKD